MIAITSYKIDSDGEVVGDPIPIALYNNEPAVSQTTFRSFMVM